MSGKTKAKGTTKASLYGKTENPIDGAILKVMSKNPGFDHPKIRQLSYRVMFRDPTGKLMMCWFNTYLETLDNGTKTPEYIGKDVDLSKNQAALRDEADFDAKCAAKSYTTVVSSDNWPPSCRSGLAVVATESVEDDDIDIPVLESGTEVTFEVGEVDLTDL